METNSEYITPSVDTQNGMILNYLKSGNKINALQALRLFGCFRLASRIHDLQNKYGIEIKGTMKAGSNGKRFKEYYL